MDYLAVAKSFLRVKYSIVHIILVQYNLKYSWSLFKSDSRSMYINGGLIGVRLNNTFYVVVCILVKIYIVSSFKFVIVILY
jgi:hypothetical protein